MKLKTAVIGTGNMGKNHARIYSELETSDLVAICDVIEEGRKIAEEYGCKFYTDCNEMLKKEKPDIVSVCVPTKLHYDIAKLVINSGSNILIEKPITDNIENAEELLKLAEEKNVQLSVGHIERFNPAVQKLKELIDDGKIGKITSILARRVGLFPPQIKDANVVIDLAVHDVDIFNYMLGKKPERVSIERGTALITKRADYADIFLKYPDNINCFVQVNWITPVKIRKLSITGTKGYAELDYITQDLVFYKSNYKKDYNGFGDFVVNFGKPEKIAVEIEKGEPLKKELESFIEAVQNNKEPVVKGRQAVDVLKILMDAEDKETGGNNE